MMSYLAFIYFQLRTHQGIYDAIFFEEDLRNDDRREELSRSRLTLTESLLAIAVCIGLVIEISFVLEDQISYLITERHIPGAFVGLFLIPIVEKAAEHLGAITEAYNNQMNNAVGQILGGTIQTALFTGPLIVIVGWGMNKPMGLDFALFDMVVLMLGVLAVGNFLRDQKSNYLEGLLSLVNYIGIGIAAFYYPDLR